MSTIVTACVAACLASYSVDKSRYTMVDSDARQVSSLSDRPDADDLETLKSRQCYWSSSGVEYETPTKTSLLDDLHQYDFVCLKPDNLNNKLQQVAQIEEIILREGIRVFFLRNFRRIGDKDSTLKPVGNTFELLCRDLIESRCWVEDTNLRKADFISSAKVCVCSLCADRRRIRDSALRKLRKIKALSLFGGAGGMDLGLPEASFRTEIMIDSDPASCTTFRKHHPSAQVIQSDVGVALRDKVIESGDKGIDLIIMGPPCQSFSKLNRQDRHARALDPRSLCVATGLSYVETFRPTYGIIENVMGMLENGDLGDIPKNGVVRFILQCLATLGYNIRLCVLQSNAFGVPQKRTRLVFLFARSDVTLPLAPVGDYTSGSGPSRYLPVSVSDAISDLPRWEWENPRRYAPKTLPLETRRTSLIPSTLSIKRDGQVNGPFWCDYFSEPQNRFQAWLRRSKNSQVQQHYLLPPFGDPLRTAERVCHIPFRKRSNHLALIPIASLALPELTNTLDEVVFTNAFGRLDPDAQSPTITTDINLRGKSGRMLMPDQNRLPSIRELARVQGFPDGITFYGSPSEILRQIGNAVPGPLAFALGESIMKAASTDFLNGDRRFARKV